MQVAVFSLVIDAASICRAVLSSITQPTLTRAEAAFTSIMKVFSKSIQPQSLTILLRVLAAASRDVPMPR